MAIDTGRDPSGQALVSDGAATHLHPTGFDPSRFEWRVQTARFSHGKDLRISGIIVGSVFYDSVSSREIKGRYKIETRLPGFRPLTDRFALEKDAMAALERLTVQWFAKMIPAQGVRA
jgi:hypothetical protein